MTEQTPAEMVAQYIKLRNYKEAAKDELEKSLVRVNTAMELLENRLLQHLQDTGTEALRADTGTAYVRTVTNVSVENEEEFVKFVSEAGWDALDIKANKTFVKEMLAKDGTAPPGVKVTSIRKIGIRSPQA